MNMKFSRQMYWRRWTYE